METINPDIPIDQTNSLNIVFPILIILIRM